MIKFPRQLMVLLILVRSRLRDGKTYKVRSTNLGYYKTPNEVSLAKFQFIHQLTVDEWDQAQTLEKWYHKNRNDQVSHYSSSKELANSKGTIRLANVLTG